MQQEVEVCNLKRVCSPVSCRIHEPRGVYVYEE